MGQLPPVERWHLVATLLETGSIEGSRGGKLEAGSSYQTWTLGRLLGRISEAESAHFCLSADPWPSLLPANTQLWLFLHFFPPPPFLFFLIFVFETRLQVAQTGLKFPI